MRQARPRAGLSVLLFGFAAAGCSSQGQTAAGEAAAAVGLPAQVAAQVTFIAQRDAYLDTAVDTRRSKLRFFFPSSETCRAVVSGPGEATYSNLGPYGRLSRGGRHCDPVGLLSLRAWRDRRPRQTSLRGTPVPRDTAEYRIVYTDEDVIMARGRFQLAGLVGWAGSYDTIAVFPNAPECSEVLSEERATMEYRDAGTHPLVLRRNRQRCPFLGFAMLNPGA